MQVNIAIMRTFGRLRQMLLSNADLAGKLGALEKKYDVQFKIVFDAIRELMIPSRASKATDRIASRQLNLPAIVRSTHPLLGFTNPEGIAAAN